MAHKQPLLYAFTGAVATFDKPVKEWTDDQKLALLEHQTDIQRYTDRIDRHDMTMYDDNGGLERLIRLYGRVFFVGKLQSVRLIPSTTLFQTKGAYGVTCQRQGAMPYIELDVACEMRPGDTELWQFRLGVLLHELVHAYLQEVACQGLEDDDDCGKNRCISRWDEWYCKGGHGPAWQLLAEAVERVFNSVLGQGGKIWLGRADALQHHLDEEEDELPEAVMKRCFPGYKVRGV